MGSSSTLPLREHYKNSGNKGGLRNFSRGTQTPPRGLNNELYLSLHSSQHRCCSTALDNNNNNVIFIQAKLVQQKLLSIKDLSRNIHKLLITKKLEAKS